MNNSSFSLTSGALAKADVYTNLSGLQSIKAEKNGEEALKKVAQQFESLFISMMMKNMRNANAVFEKDSLFNSDESQFYRDLLDKQQSLSISHGRGLGIAEALYRQMSKTYGTNGAADTIQTHRTPIDATRVKKEPEADSNATGLLHSPRVAVARSPEEFIDRVLPYAEKASEMLGVDKSIILAQAALETGWGEFVLANREGQSSNNLFNIKRGGQWSRNSVAQTTLEYDGNVVRKESAEFRVYNNIEESFDDYVQFISENDRYRQAVNSSDHEVYIRELHSAGYATDPRYSEKVLSVHRRINALVDQKSPEIVAASSKERGGHQ